jgi:hypothetical protein
MATDCFRKTLWLLWVMLPPAVTRAEVITFQAAATMLTARSGVTVTINRTVTNNPGQNLYASNFFFNFFGYHPTAISSIQDLGVRTEFPTPNGTTPGSVSLFDPQVGAAPAGSSFPVHVQLEDSLSDLGRVESVTVSIPRTVKARAHPKQTWYCVNVFTTSQAPLPRVLLADGQDAAGALFSRIHVRLVWHNTGPTPTRHPSPCLSELTRPNIAVQIVRHAPRDVSQIGLAMASLQPQLGDRILIFFDRIEPLLSSHDAPPGRVMGYVFAHEIAHVLQGVPHHSDVGILRERWTKTDLYQIGRTLLTWTDEDAEIIRMHLASLPRVSTPCCSLP